MPWSSETENNSSTWPTWNSRLTWARNNYGKKPEHDVTWKLEKFLVMLANLTALNDLIEAEAQEALLTPKQKKQYQELYEQYRPTRAIGRPKNGK